MPPKVIYLIELSEGHWIVSIDPMIESKLSTIMKDVKNIYTLELDWRLHESGGGPEMSSMRSSEERSQVDPESA